MKEIYLFESLENLDEYVWTNGISFGEKKE